MDLSVLEQLCFSTVRIETEDSLQKKYSGTGFFFNLSLGNNTVPLIITNKHVVNGMNSGHFLINEAYDNGAPKSGISFPISFNEDFEKLWIMHPDPYVDLCVMPYNVLVQMAERIFHKKLFYRCFDDSLIPTVSQEEEMDAVEDIIMIGYPNGLWDEVNNMPIIRKGITATKFSLDYNGNKEFIIDASCFPGSSGSPVILFNKGGYTDKKGTLNWDGGRLMLLGILYASPKLTVDGSIRVVKTPDAQILGVQSNIPNNLGYVIKSKVIQEFVPLLEARYRTKVAFRK